MSAHVVEKATGNPLRDGRPIVQNRLAVLVALLCIAVTLVFLGRARQAAQPAYGVQVVVTGESRVRWTEQAGDELARVGRTIRTSVKRNLLPRRVPGYVVGMVICTVLAGVILVYPR